MQPVLMVPTEQHPPIEILHVRAMKTPTGLTWGWFATSCVWVSQSPLAASGSACGGQTPWACAPSARSCQCWGDLSSRWLAPAAPLVCLPVRQELCHAACASSSQEALFLTSFPPEQHPTLNTTCQHITWCAYIYICYRLKQKPRDVAFMASYLIHKTMCWCWPRNSKLMVLKTEEAITCLLISLNFH